MKEMIEERYSWEGLQEDASEYVEGCVTCSRGQFRHTPIETSTPGSSKEKGPREVHVDFWGPLAWDGEEHTVLTMTDYLSNWAEAVIIPDRQPSTIATALVTEWITRFGIPSTITSDNTEEFMSDVIERLGAITESSKTETITHQQGRHPSVEQFHRSLGETFKYMYLMAPGSTNVHEAVALALTVYRTLPHGTTGESPAYTTFGTDLAIRAMDQNFNSTKSSRENRFRVEILQRLRREQITRQLQVQQTAEVEDLSVRRYELGDLVLLQLTERQMQEYSRRIGSSSTLLSGWSLPMRVIQVNPLGTTATLRCLGSAYIASSCIGRVRFIKKPITLHPSGDWRSAISTEGSLYDQLLNIDQSQQRLTSMGLPGVVSRGQIVGINSQTLQTPDNLTYKAPTSNNGENATYIGATKEGEGQPVLRNVKNSMMDGERKEVAASNDKDGYDLGASCSNQRNENSKDSEGRGLRRK